MTLTDVEPLQKFMKINGAVDLEQQSGKRRSRKNQEILIFTCTAFFLFALAEVVGAIASNSLSLLGDAGAMSIDVFTYICNIYAERLKAGDVEISDRMRFILEILIPAISLCCLLIVTGYVTNEAIHVLLNPSDDHEKNGDEDVFLSYRIQKRYDSYNSLADEMQEGTEHDAKVVSAANLNMISAFTHLTGDSMRTFSVIIAALVSTIAKIPSNICDAYAAIVVTITIAFMVIPLIREIWKAMVKA